MRLLSTDLLLCLDAINLELASRCGELSSEQIGHLCSSISYLVDAHSFHHQVEEGSDALGGSTCEEILGMKLLLVELADQGIIQVELKTFSHEHFSAVYQAYLGAGLLRDSTQAQNEGASQQESKGSQEDNPHFSAPLHEKLVSELRLRRLGFMSVEGMVTLLHSYTLSGTLSMGSVTCVDPETDTKMPSPEAKFVEACDKFLGKNSDTISAGEMTWIFRLYRILR